MNATEDRIREIMQCQYHDPQRGPFLVGLKPHTVNGVPERSNGRSVYIDRFGKRYVFA